MRIGILSRDPGLYSTQRLVEAAKQKGHEVIVVDGLKCYMNITSNNPTVLFKDKVLELDAIIPRIGASVTSYATAVLRQFEMSGVYTVNESVAITRSRDKLRAHQLLARKGIGMPVTGYASSTEQTENLIKLVGGAPLVVKLIESSLGKGVVLAETHEAAESVINAFRGLNANFLVQEFIKEAKGSDIRCFVVGNKVVASMKRKARPGDFRSNLHRGGSAEPVKLSPEERSIAVRSARIIGLNVAGVDIIRSKHGPLILEVNSSPGLEGIEGVTGKDIASMIINYIENHARKGKNKTKGKG